MTAARSATPRPSREPASPPAPSGILFFVHGANETSQGLIKNVARLEDQIRNRGWDVRVVAPEWRRRSGLRLGDWPKALYRGPRTAPLPIPKFGAGIRKEAIAKLVTYYYEDRRVALIDQVGAQLLADVIGYHRHRDSIHAVLREELDRAKAAAGERPVLPVALSLGGIALIDLLAAWPDAPVEACVTVGSQAPLLYTFDALDALPYDEADPPRLEMPWLNIYDSRDFLSFVAEPLFRRSDGLASVVDLRVHSDRDFPASHSAYWEQAPVWDAIATVFGWRRTDRLTVREARRLGFEARKAAVPAGE